jgi:hypothetical protein
MGFTIIINLRYTLIPVQMDLLRKFAHHRKSFVAPPSRERCGSIENARLEAGATKIKTKFSRDLSGALSVLILAIEKTAPRPKSC